MKTLVLLLSVLILLAGCKNRPHQELPKEMSFSLVKVWSTDTLLRTPESVLYDEERDVIYVSNINSGPAEKDTNGFISKLDAQGEIVELKWITGLSAPKGMGIAGDKLFVTDVDELVIIDIPHSVIMEKVPFEGATFLNDLSIDTTGKVYISDSRENRIYTYDEGKTEVWISEGITKSNGLLCEPDRLLLASSDVNAIDYKTKVVSVINDGIQGGDGIAAAGGGYYFVSEWPGEVFLIQPDSSMVSLLNTRAEEINSADIDYIQKDSLLLVPTFFKNTIEAYKWVVK